MWNKFFGVMRYLNLLFCFLLLFCLVSVGSWGKNYSQNSSLGYVILDNSLYYASGRKMELILDNIIDFTYVDDNIILFQKNNYLLSIYSLDKNVKNDDWLNFIPFFRREHRIKKLVEFDLGKNEYVGNIVKYYSKNISKLFVLLTQSVVVLQKDNKNIKATNFMNFNDYKIVYTSSDFLTFQKDTNFYVYDVDNITKPLFTLSNVNLLQVLKMKEFFISLCTTKDYNYLVVKLFKDGIFKDLYYQAVRISYDSLFYMLPINDSFIAIQKNYNLTIFELDSYQNILKEVETYPSYYSYFQDNYLFVLNLDNLSVFYLNNQNFDPLFSIPYVSYFYFDKGELFYVFYDKGDKIWKLSIVSLKDKLLIEKDRIPLYSFPEKIIPLGRGI